MVTTCYRWRCVGVLVAVLVAANLFIPGDAGVDIDWRLPLRQKEVQVDCGETLNFLWYSVESVYKISSATEAAACDFSAAVELHPLTMTGRYQYQVTDKADFWVSNVDTDHCMLGQTTHVKVNCPNGLPAGFVASRNSPQVTGTPVCRSGPGQPARTCDAQAPLPSTRTATDPGTSVQPPAPAAVADTPSQSGGVGIASAADVLPLLLNPQQPILPQLAVPPIDSLP